MIPKYVEDVEFLLNPSQLQLIIGMNETLTVTPLKTLGYSGSTFYSVVPSDQSSKYLVKRTVLAEDWFSQRIKDVTGREGSVLISTEFSEIYNIFNMPYLAVSMNRGSIGLLMDDVSDWLLPDERKPIPLETEELVIEHIARMHARFWQESNLNSFNWLLEPADYFYIMGPLDLENNTSRAGSARGVDRMVRNGWDVARKLLNPKLTEVLWKAPSILWDHWSHLPVTLLHGDTKLANFAIKPGNNLVLFDWAFVGRGPSTFDIGWYIAVNASRLSRSKEEIFDVYKAMLEKYLGKIIDELTWQAMVDAGIFCGALMLLWAKASAFEQNRDGSSDEWNWWCRKLEEISERISL